MGSGARLFNIYFNDIWIAGPGGEATQSNARTDTLRSKPLWRIPFHRRRCLVPADGFYEWKRLDEKTKQPYAFALRSGEPFAFGGVWDAWFLTRGAVSTNLNRAALNPDITAFNLE